MARARARARRARSKVAETIQDTQSRGASPFERLPPELIIIIISHLRKSDIKAARLTSTVLSSCCLSELYSELDIFYTKESIVHAEAVANHDEYRGMVRAMTIWLPVLHGTGERWSQAVERAYHTFMPRRSVRGGLEQPPAAQPSPFAEQFTGRELQRGLARYRQFYAEQKDAVQAPDRADRLAVVMSRLVSLRKVRLGDPHTLISVPGALSPQGVIGKLADEMLLEVPNSHFRNSHHNRPAALDAITCIFSALHRCHTRHLTLELGHREWENSLAGTFGVREQDLPLFQTSNQPLAATSQLPPVANDVFAMIDHFSLCLDMVTAAPGYPQDNHKMPRYWGVLHLMSSLKSLKLSLTDSRVHKRRLRYRRPVLFRDCHWPRLETITITNTCLLAPDFVGFCSTHRHNIRNVRLEYVGTHEEGSMKLCLAALKKCPLLVAATTTAEASSSVGAARRHGFCAYNLCELQRTEDFPLGGTLHLIYYSERGARRFIQGETDEPASGFEVDMSMICLDGFIPCY